MKKYLKVIIKCLPILVWAYISWIFRYSRHPEKYDLRLRFSKVQSLIRKVLKAFNVIIKEVDVDKFENLARNYSVMSIPTLILFKKGQIVDKKIGFIPEVMLNEWINNNR